MRQVTHALLTRPPLSHFFIPRKSKCFVRRACVRHAASVHPEPGSNSHVYILTEWQLAVIFPFFTVLVKSFDLVRFFEILFKELSGLFYCSIVNVLCRCFSHATFVMLSHLSSLVNNFFNLFFQTLSNLMLFFATALIDYHIHLLLSTTFFIFLKKFFQPVITQYTQTEFSF